MNQNLFAFFNIDDCDALKITWAHAVNSFDSLNNSLNNNNIFMIESDVIISSTTNIPVMAHPPATHSDLTFEQWLQNLCNWTESKKGAKADFKSIESAELAMPLISKYQQNMRDIPFWLNADICNGVPGSKQPLNGSVFLNLCKQHIPRCTLSLGWTTPANLTEDMRNKGGYGNNEINAMISLLENVSAQTSITFPVRAVLLKGNLTDITNLVMKSCNYSLTVWTSNADDLQDADFRALLELRRTCGKNRVFYDLPDTNLSRLKSFLQ